MVYDGLSDYFGKNPKELKRICDFVKANAKIRLKSQEARNSVIRGESTNLDEHRIKNFYPANNGKHNYKELFIIEGNSAAGSADNCRDRNTMALFGLKGVPLNTYGLDLTKVLLNDEFRDLTKILGCNIGDRFNLDKLRYNKIIVMADSDIDGLRIASLMSTFFLYHLPQIVEVGRLYKSISPLYSINDKKNPFVLSKKEYIKLFETKIGRSIRIIDIKTHRPLTGKILEEFLFDNRSYLEDLRRTANHFAVHPVLLEFLIFYRNRKDFKSRITDRFPEIHLIDNIVTGIYEGRFQNIILDDIFHKRIKDMDELIFNVNNGNIYYEIQEFNGKTYGNKSIVTIGDLMSLCQKFLPIIKARFKGLGELNPNELWETTMNPNTRRLIRLSINDITQDLENLKILHGTDIAKRKKIMEFFKLNRDDIDN